MTMVCWFKLHMFNSLGQDLRVKLLKQVLGGLSDSSCKALDNHVRHIVHIRLPAWRCFTDLYQRDHTTDQPQGVAKTPSATLVGSTRWP